MITRKNISIIKSLSIKMNDLSLFQMCEGVETSLNTV